MRTTGEMARAMTADGMKAGGMTIEEAVDLLDDVAGWVAGPMTPGRVSRLRAWFRDHPPALTPEFQAFLRLFLARELEGRRQDEQYAWMADAARFLLRVIHVCNEAGAEEGLARLFAAANRPDEFQTRS
ncbi:hypothetical protein ABGB09_33955 [Streptomyces sp. B8F3]|uniref:hypothetical protein n=1 Tax=Streptomyces sp. B8F3 TaxID=3153573 RepID=UPI00325D9987